MTKQNEKKLNTYRKKYKAATATRTEEKGFEEISEKGGV